MTNKFRYQPMFNFMLMKRQEEDQLMNDFKNLYTAFPKGKLVKKEPPFTDFILQTKRKTIGIELTEVFQDVALTKHSSYKSLLNEKVLESLKPMLPFDFSIDIQFDAEKKIEKTGYDSFVKTITAACTKHFSDLQNMERRDYYNIGLDLDKAENKNIKEILALQGFRNLPHGVQSIHMRRYDGLAHSWHSRHEGSAVADLTFGHLVHILDKKEDKLKKYAYCNEFWLIIKEGNYYAGSFSEIKIDAPIKSAFNKVFLFRTSRHQVIDLTGAHSF